MRSFMNLAARVNGYKFIALMGLVFSILTNCGIGASQPLMNLESDVYNSAFLQLEESYNARIGVYALDTETNSVIAYHADDRFPYCSTYKALAVGAILQQDSIEQLKQVVKYTEKDVLAYAPVTKDHVAKGMTVAEICNAAIRFSDNTAGNLLFDHIGGVKGFQAALYQIGDRVTQPARREPELNEAIPGDVRDTSTPRQLAKDLQAYAIGDILTDDKKKIFIDWLTGNATGSKLIRAGAPKDWIVADKSGAGSYGTRNDIAIVMPPDRKPIIIAILSTHPIKEAQYDNNLIAQAAKIVFDSFTVARNNASSK